MKRRNINLIVLLLGCFALWPRMVAAGGGPPSNCNTSEGYQALFNVTTGFDDSAFGGRALFNDTSGSDNTALGCGALVANTTGNQNTATGSQALSRNIRGIDNTANGYQALYNYMGDGNTATGYQALFQNTDGVYNTATGYQALYSNSDVYNTANGFRALYSNTIGGFNTAVGESALGSNTTGYTNIALGAGAGDQLTTGCCNIDIGNSGVPDESNTIRIGESFDPHYGSGQNRTFIAGIWGIFPGLEDAIPVVIDSAGQLGTTAQSSSRFKTEIKPMNKASEAILALKPVTFHFKNNAKGKPQFGLIAEDVVKVNPDLVVRDNNGEIYSVRYDAVNAMLLNEFLKEHRRVAEQQSKIDEQQSTITELKSTVAQQQKRMETLTTQLKEQATQIRKVSAQIEMSEPAAHVAGRD